MKERPHTVEQGVLCRIEGGESLRPTQKLNNLGTV